MKRFMSALLLAVLVLTPVLVYAQDGDEWEEYVSEDEKLTAAYPAGWVAVDADPEDLPFPGATFINSEDGVERFEADEDPLSGDAAIMVLLMPVDFLAFFGTEMPEEPTVLDYATVLATAFTEPDEGEEAPEVSEPEEFTVGEGDEALTFGYVEIKDARSEGAFIVYEIGEGLLALTITQTFPGEYTDELAEAGGVVAGSLSYDGTAEEIMIAAMAGADLGEPSGDAGSLDGEALVAERCTVCHSAERIDDKMAAGADRTEWEATVDRMIGYGANLNDDEREAVLIYLAGE